MESFELFWEATCGKCNIKADELRRGDTVENINPKCKQYKSRGKVVKVNKLKCRDGTCAGKVVEYKCSNKGKRFKKGQKLKKTEIQLRKSRK